MLQRMGIIILSLVCFLPAAKAQEAVIDSTTLEVRVEGIRNDKGEIGVALFNNPTGYPTLLQNAYNIQWVSLKEGPKAVDVRFEGVPLGDYAVSVIHDENVNGMLETGASGFPMEGVGFSNNQKVVMSAPSFNASKFSLSKAEPMKMTIQLEYRQ